MKELLKYRDNSYFNATDFYLALNNIGQWYLTDLELYNGKWFPKYYKGFRGGKMYSSGHWRVINKPYFKGCTQVNIACIPCINFKELYGREVRYVNTELKGRITNVVIHNFGVNWNKNQGKLF